MKKRHLFRKKAKIHDMENDEKQKVNNYWAHNIDIAYFPGCGTEKNAETIEENF